MVGNGEIKTSRQINYSLFTDRMQGKLVGNGKSHVAGMGKKNQQQQQKKKKKRVERNKNEESETRPGERKTERKEGERERDRKGKKEVEKVKIKEMNHEDVVKHRGNNLSFSRGRKSFAK
ncbi:hypothetical protein RUM44_007245 [Polyplax serrata]|uniref:Uncharacterized protein n=1 Tax=Polyplax serrata TaxID=468196 RepID=A0ABR1B063_POLSC